MRVIDMHHHWVNEAGYLDRLLGEMDRLDIERTGLIAMGQPFRRLFLTQGEPVGCADNQDVPAVIARRSIDSSLRLLPAGHDEASLIDWFADHGFAGVKFHIPAWDYDDERCFPPTSERGPRAGLPFSHRGVHPAGASAGPAVSSARCRPILLDAIATPILRCG